MTYRFAAPASLLGGALLLSACTPGVRPPARSTPEPTELNWRATPLYGTVTLRAGFSPDPTTRRVQAGGTARNPVSGEGCEGYLNASAPDLDLNYSAGNLPLTISAASDMDISMVVYTPDGQWICDDDSGEGLNPSVTFNSPKNGNYNIWIATYARTEQRPQSTVGFSELRRNVAE